MSRIGGSGVLDIFEFMDHFFGVRCHKRHIFTIQFIVENETVKQSCTSVFVVFNLQCLHNYYVSSVLHEIMARERLGDGFY